MGAEPWHYFTPYEEDISAALNRLKEQEFRAGRYGFDYWCSQISALLPEGVADRSPGLLEMLNDRANQSKPTADELIEQYGSIEAAMEAVLEESAPDGTYSILDMQSVSEQPEICAVCSLSEEELRSMFQTTEPTREQVEAVLLNEESFTEHRDPWEMFWESINRGEGRYIVIYENGQPTEIFFAGYSFD